MDIANKAKEVESDWRHYSLPDQYLEKFVFENLMGKSTDLYDLPALLSREAITALLGLGEQIINAKKQNKGLVTVGSDGMEDRTKFAPNYEKIFSDWENAGWILKEIVSETEVRIKLAE